MNYNSSNQVRNIQNMQEQMSKLRQLQQMKNTERLSELESIIDKDKIKESVIRPLKEPKADIKELEKTWIVKQNNLEPERQEHWRARTNQPYKNILKNIDYNKIQYLTDQERDTLTKNTDYSKFYQHLGRTGKDLAEEELIVHKVTDADKLEERLMAELDVINNFIKKHDKELTVIYSLSNELSHKKKFDYENVNKYEKIKYDPADFADMKKDKIELFKKEQEYLEKDKKKVDDIIENLVNKGMISEQDAQDIYGNDGENNDKSYGNSDDEEIDLDKLEQQLLKELSHDDIKSIQKETNESSSSNNDILDKPKATLRRKIDESKTDSKETQQTDEAKPKARLIRKTTEKSEQSENKEKPDDKIIADVSSDIKNKYKQRQKQN
jgi:hypothetical protein